MLRIAAVDAPALWLGIEALSARVSVAQSLYVIGNCRSQSLQDETSLPMLKKVLGGIEPRRETMT
jgi:hypothetical protein